MPRFGILIFFQTIRFLPILHDIELIINSCWGWGRNVDAGTSAPIPDARSAPA